MKESVHEMRVRVPTKNVGYVLELTEGVDQGPKGPDIVKISEYPMTSKAPSGGPGRGKGNRSLATGAEIIAQKYAPGTTFQRPLAVQAIVKAGRSKSYAQQTISDMLTKGKIAKQPDGSYIVVVPQNTEVTGG